ncbi:hypothetical protein H6778_01900 [Candidatus Nomurabacteria bacterium]|nr:hypothetical protein [Candidatus Nomurabacteria bacterium]
MDTFFTHLKKGIVATTFMIFAFAMTYVPQDWNQVKEAHAGGAGGGALEVTQLGQWASDKVFQAASIAQETITAIATNSIWIKEYVLDGIAWAIAKAIISNLLSSLIDWINSGFQGSPAFIQNLELFLRDQADIAIGQYLDELGGIGSFLCEPFRLDVQVAVALQYERTRVDQPTRDCTLTGIIDNIDGFLSGTADSFDEGGWNDWFDVTSAPEVYTPYGQILSAQTGAEIRILGEKGREAAKLEWGDGFLSGEICELVGGADTTKEECFISKPGKIIEEALSFNLDSGRQSLITADEIDEVVSALISQLANTVITGAAGLLGLSGGTGYTYTGFNAGSYLDAVNQEAIESLGGQTGGNNSGTSLQTMQTSLATQTSLQDSALQYRSQLEAKQALGTLSAAQTSQVNSALTEINTVVNNTDQDISTISNLITQYNAATGNTAQQAIIITEFDSLTLYSQGQVNNLTAGWSSLLSSLPNS